MLFPKKKIHEKKTTKALAIDEQAAIQIVAEEKKYLKNTSVVQFGEINIKSTQNKLAELTCKEVVD